MSLVPVAAVGDAGFGAADAAGREALVERADEAFRGAVGTASTWAWFVPGRIEVFGKHTDYAGGASLVAAVPRGIALVAAPRRDNRIVAVDARWPGRAIVDRGSAPPAHGWARYVHVVAERFARNFPGAESGVDIAIASDLPRAAGLSSSSALVVGVALALARRGQLADRIEWKAAIGSEASSSDADGTGARLRLAGYLGSVEAGRGFRSLGAASGVGTEGGSEDHTAILASAAGLLRSFSYAPIVTQLDEAVMPSSWQFVVMTSGVRADKAGRVRDRYNRASRSAALLARIWNDQHGASRTLASIAAEPDDLERLQALVERTDTPEFSSAQLAKRLAHFVAEHRRVAEATAAFRLANREVLGALSAASQHQAGSLLGNQVPETTALSDAAKDVGAFAASSFGAGFGGSVWALVDGGDPEAFAASWRARYQSACPHIEHVDWFAARPGPGAFEIGRPA